MAVGDLFTMVLAPDQVLVAAHIDVDDDLEGDDVEQMAQDLEEDLRREVPSVAQVFLDPTPRRERAAAPR